MATSEEVARLAGVSRATVSRVLSGTAKVSDATRSRVEQAAARLGYEPDVAAQSLRAARSKTIALGFFTNEVWAMSQLSWPRFHLKVLRHIEAAVTKAGYDLLIPSQPSDTTSSSSYMGHRRIARVTGAEDSPAGRDRIAGVRQAPAILPAPIVLPTEVIIRRSAEKPRA